MRDLARTLLLVALCGLLAAATALLWLDREALRREIQELRRAPPTVSERIREVVREVPSGQPVRTEVRVVDRPVPVEVSRVVERVEVRPGETRTVERVVTVSEPVPCRTEQECRRIFAASPQTITVEARLRAGTPVPVEVDGQVAEVRLARDVPIRIELVQAEGGVHVALDRTDSPVAVDRVVTETRVVAVHPQPTRWKAMLASSDRLAVGVGYEAVRIGSSLSLDVAALWAPSDGSARIGAGVGWSVSPSVSIGALYGSDSRLWGYIGVRF